MLASGVSLLPTAFTAAGLNDGTLCLSAAGVSTNQTPPDDVLHSAAYRACISGHWTLPQWVGPAVPGFLLVLACGLFFALPVWKARRSRVVLLSAVDHDGWIRWQLEQLAQVAGLKRMPRVVVDPSAASTSAAVFGRNGRPTVCLHGGLLARRATAPTDFQAVVLHEMAHIRNGDVTLTYATVALWRTFIAAVLAPYAVGFGILIFNSYAPETRPYEIGLPAWRALVLPLVMTAVVYLARSDVLRSRELHADFTAAHWGANPRIWGATEPAPPARVLPRMLRSFIELWRTHPRWDSRRKMLADPTPLFEVPGLLMFLTGTAVILVNSQLWNYVGASGRAGQWEWNVVMALPPAVLVTGVAGTVLWRSVVHRLLTGRRRLSGAWAGLWLGVGMTAGELIANRVAIFRWLPGEPMFVMLLGLAGLTFAWWVTQCSHLWATVWRGRTMLAPMMLVLAGACLALCAWFWWWQNYGVFLANVPGLWAHALAPGHGDVLADPSGEYTAILNFGARAVGLLSTTVAVPLALPAVAVLWVVPLLAWAVHPLATGRDRAPAPGTGEPVISGLPLPPLRRALLPGLLGGVVCWVGLAAVKAHMHAWGWQTPLRLPGVAGAFLFQYGASAALLAGAAVAALVASPLVDRYRLIAALVAANVAALAGYGGVWALSASDGCIQDISTFTPTCGWRPVALWQAFQYLLSILLVLVTVVGIASAATTSAVQRLFRRRPRPTTFNPTGNGLRKLVPHRLAVAVLCTAAVGLPAALLSLPLPSGNGTASAAKPATNPIQEAQEASDQTSAWYDLGGRKLLVRYADTLGRLQALVSNAQQSSDPDGFITSRLPSICTEFGKIARDADAYFPVPDSRLLPTYKTFTTMTAKGSQDCLTGLDQNDAVPLTTGMKEIGQATRASNSISAWINTIRKESSF
ncbi:M56 family metallopeptidase [Streptomyces sp. RB6PN23]|uniref:M56 family metallopeptidase n=1 Tax=Streptomyces silvisoli TaxID=3034235 RepID=A0ABT5ZWZ0_9ACTN|nr:M56 family metallopeptidase [Streptomyces silvisoli]